MSKLSEAIDWNRKRNEHGLQRVDAAKSKSYLSRGTDSMGPGKVSRFLEQKAKGRTEPVKRQYEAGENVGRGPAPAPWPTEKQKAFPTQKKQPAWMASDPPYVTGLQRQSSPESVGTADPSGPLEPTSADKMDYKPPVQPVSSSAAGYQGTPQSTGISYAAGHQKEKTVTRGGPFQPDYIQETEAADPYDGSQSPRGFSSVREGGFSHSEKAGGLGGHVYVGAKDDARAAESLSAQLRLGEASDQDFETYLDQIKQTYGYSPEMGSQEEMLSDVQSYLRSLQPKAQNYTEQRAEGTDPLSRVWNTVKGAGKQYAGSMAQTGATTVDQVGLDRIIDHFSGPTGTPISAPLLKLATIPLERKLVDTAQDFSDKASESGAQDIAKAQEGLNPMRRMLVNAGVGVTQMTGDAALALATGGSSMIFMAARAFGGGVQEARAKGYNERQQVALGLTSAATEYFTERLFGGNPVYDTDVGIVNWLVGKVTKNPKVMEFLASAPVDKVTEGLEEMVSDVLNPIAEWAITGTRPEYELDQIIEDGIVGVITAVIAEGGTKVVNKVGQGLKNQGYAYEGNDPGKEKAASTGEAGTAYTIQRDAGGDVYVQIDADILKGKPREQWGKTVQDTIKSIFGSGLKLARGTVFTNRKGRGEYTNGSYTKMLERTDPEMYQDKMRMAAGSDGILKSASDVVYEDASHERTDDIVGFNRGKIIVSVKGAGYTGDVLTAVYSDGKETFFDINNLARKTIEATTPERYAVQDGFTQADAAASTSIIPSAGDSVKGKFGPEDGEIHYSLKETPKSYEGKDLSKDGSVYSYEFLTSLPDMTVTTLPEVGTIQGKDGRINARTVVNLGMANARKVGVEKDGKIYIPNSYTGRELRLDVSSIRHGLNGDFSRLLTNAKLGTVIGDVVKNAVPINALQNKADGVAGTYAMASYAVDSRGREFVAIVTVEQRSGDVAGLEVYDVTHAINGRQKRGERVDTKSQGVYPSTNASTISIADFLSIVKQTHQSILSEDVLAQFGEKRNPAGYYTGKAQFSMKDTDSTFKAPSGEMETENTQPLTQADAKRFASETGTENGLVLDDYVQKHLRPDTAKRLNTLAQALGVRVRFVSSIRGGTANASIQGNEVQIERYNPNPVTFLLGHELTHRMQQLSPEAYTRFKEAVRADVEKEAQGLHSLYRIRGENIDFEGAMDEATANYAGRLLEKGPVLDEFIERHRTDRSLLEKVLDAVRDMISRLTGTERKQAETAEGKLLAALEETAALQKAGSDGTIKTVRYSMKDLTETEQAAVLSYKSSESYKINAKLRDGLSLTPSEQKMVDELDRALEKLPRVKGTVYRTLSFDDLSDAKGELDAFLAEHEAESVIIYPAYTSTSTKWDGHPLADGTKYGVVLEIDGESARRLDGFGNNFECEALFPRDTAFYITNVEKGLDGIYHIKMKEVIYNGGESEG